eukprot:4323191-Amphidinium_carterae.1
MPFNNHLVTTRPNQEPVMLHDMQGAIQQGTHSKLHPDSNIVTLAICLGGLWPIASSKRQAG